MKNKKWLAVLLTLVLVIMSVSGCSGKDKPDNSPADADKTDAGDAKLTYNGQDVSKPIDLVMYYIGDANKDQDKILEKVNEILKSKINATLTLKNMSLSDYATNYALTIAGGEKIDLIYTSTWAFYQSEATKGAFAEVSDQVLSDDMPLTKQNQSPASFGQAKINGKVYFVPCNMANVNANAIVIRGDLREKYGLQPLKTIDDLQVYYKAVAADKDSGVSFAYDASQNNDTSKLILYFSKNNYIQITGAIQNYFTYQYKGSAPSSSDLFWIYDDPQYLEYAKQMQSWAQEGFWSKSSIANATDTKEAFLNGTSASYSQNLGSVGATASQVLSANPEWKPEIYDLTSDADRFFAAYTGDGVAVLANSDNQARAFMALDIMKFDQDCYNLIRHGIEGTHYSMTSDGYWKIEADNANWPFGNAFSWGFKNTMYETTREDTFKDQVDIGNKWSAKAMEGPTAAFSFDDTNVKNELSNLQGIYSQYIPLLDLGLTENAEETLAEFNKQAKTAGLDKIIDEVKKQMDAYLQQ